MCQSEELEIMDRYHVVPLGRLMYSSLGWEIEVITLFSSTLPCSVSSIGRVAVLHTVGYWFKSSTEYNLQNTHKWWCASLPNWKRVSSILTFCTHCGCKREGALASLISWIFQFDSDLRY